MSRASEAYDALQSAMWNAEPGCVGIDLFTADDLGKADQDSLKPICDSCPLLALCQEYAALAKPKAGYWAGRQHRTYSKGGAR
jgi:hypothetical protein